MISPLVKTFAKKTGKTTSEVAKIWNEIEQRLIKEGASVSDSDFYPRLVKELKGRIGMKEEYVMLDKFKQYLTAKD